MATANNKGKLHKYYPYNQIKTPYDKLKSLDNDERFLKTNFNFDLLDEVALAMTDNKAANQLKLAEFKLFNAVFEQ